MDFSVRTSRDDGTANNSRAMSERDAISRWGGEGPLEPGLNRFHHLLGRGIPRRIEDKRTRDDFAELDFVFSVGMRDLVVFGQERVEFWESSQIPTKSDPGARFHMRRGVSSVCEVTATGR